MNRTRLFALQKWSISDTVAPTNVAGCDARLLLAQNRDDLLFAKAAPIHRSSPFSGD